MPHIRRACSMTGMPYDWKSDPAINDRAHQGVDIDSSHFPVDPIQSQIMWDGPDYY